MNLQIICPLFLAVSVFGAEITPPVVLDADLEISLFASEPDIVTPIGMAIDRQDRLYVVESHTHETKANYPGPKHDRVKIFQDRRGKSDKISIFADDLHHAMNIAFSPEQKLYLVYRNGVMILHDRDGDGVSESRSTVLEMQTSGTYPHNGLDGIAFSPEGWLYVGLGENLGRPYTIKGTDGSQCSGRGEGGNIFRCRLDGIKLQLVATGFWNPFALAVDRAGNLFAVDNDPDGRPPCRLLHVVEHGDYGYKFRYGRSGQHPFVAWEGELPGTLPMVAGTGEAPSGILDSARAALPSAYKGSFIVTAWGDNTLERYRLKPVGASFRATREIVAQGDKSFWPVSIAADSNGVIYITDWADREYSVHQKGRIWRLAAKPGVQVSKPEGATAHAKSSPALERMTQLLNAHSSGDYNELMRALTDVDPFIRSAAVSSLSQSVYRPNALHDVTHEDPQVRIGVLLALRRAKYDQAVPLLRKFISDPDEQVRRMALVWIGEDILKELANDIDRALGAGPLSPTLFSTYLASAEILAFGEPGSTQANSKDIWAAGRTRSQFIDRIIEDELKPINLRALAISMVPDLSDEKSLDALTKVAHGNVLQLQIEAVRTLAESSQSKVVSLLQSLAFNKNNPANLRAEAIAGLARQPVDVLWSVIDLLDDPSEPGSNGSNASLANGGNGQSRPKGFRQEIRGEQKGGV